MTAQAEAKKKFQEGRDGEYHYPESARANPKDGTVWVKGQPKALWIGGAATDRQSRRSIVRVRVGALPVRRYPSRIGGRFARWATTCGPSAQASQTLSNCPGTHSFS